MSNTPNLALAYIAAGQAQKEVTHNASLDLIDALLQAAKLTTRVLTIMLASEY